MDQELEFIPPELCLFQCLYDRASAFYFDK